jgi:hypothetical protein
MAAGSQRIEQQSHDRREVEGTVIISLRRMPPARVALGLGPVKAIDRCSNGVAAAPAQAARELIRQNGLAGRRSPVDRDPDRPAQR